MDNWKKQIKLYQVNKNFYSLKDINSSEDVIKHIINYHKSNFESPHEVVNDVSKLHYSDIELFFYLFKERDRVSSWKDFLPEEITENHDFKLISTSFVLFSVLDDQIYALIGGKGISVIKRFYNQSFGIELLSKITEPQNDIVHKLVGRSIIGKLTTEQKTYRNQQKLADALEIGTVPKEIFITLRKEVKDSLFDFLEFTDDEEVILHSSSSFHLNKSLDFEETINVLKRLHHINVNATTAAISRFEKVVDDDFCQKELLPTLLSDLRDDAANLWSNNYNEYNSLDYDFAHPDKYIPFIEAERYEAYLKGEREPFYINTSRTPIYMDVLKEVYGMVTDETDFYEFNTILLGVRIKSFTGEIKKSEAMFINHVSCEIEHSGKSYFQIDNAWYEVKGNFIDTINNECEALLSANLWKSNFMDLKWDLEIEHEGNYNEKYLKKDNTIVLDKVLSQNIELCDILHFDENNLYLIHVKKGFDAKMRDLTNQISVASTRLWNDLKSDKEFISGLYQSFVNSDNFKDSYTEEFFFSLFEKEINFILAFCNERKRFDKVLGNVKEFDSNIAKFSLIQHVKEMNSTNYPVRVVEIEKN